MRNPVFLLMEHLFKRLYHYLRSKIYRKSFQIVIAYQYMKRRRNSTILIGVIMFAGACNPSTSNGDQSSATNTGTVDAKDTAYGPSINNVAGDTTKLLNDSSTHHYSPQTAEKPSTSARILNEADKIYIDLIIPDYPDVILFHEGSAETLNYMQQVYGYLRSKNASVTKKAITQKHEEKARDKRLYIDDVGENWYEVFVFDEWK